MDSFVIGKRFLSYQTLLEAKKNYESVSNTLLIKKDCRKFKGDCDLANKFVYEYLVFECKAGSERPNYSVGIRKSSTVKRNCPFKVRLTFKKEGQLVVTSANIQHENHNIDEISLESLKKFEKTSAPVYVKKARNREVMDIHKTTASLTKEINSLSATLPTDRHTYVVKKLKSIRDEIADSNAPLMTNNVSEGSEEESCNIVLNEGIAVRENVGNMTNLTFSPSDIINIPPENFIYDDSSSTIPNPIPMTIMLNEVSVGERRDIHLNINIAVRENANCDKATFSQNNIINIPTEHFLCAGSLSTLINSQPMANSAINVPHNVTADHLYKNSQNDDGQDFGIPNHDLKSLNAIVLPNNIFYAGAYTNVSENTSVIPSTNRILNSVDFLNSTTFKHARLSPKNVKVGRPRKEENAVIVLKRKPKANIFSFLGQKGVQGAENGVL